MRLLWLELAALALLVLLLVGRCWQRARRLAREEKALSPGHGFDAAPVRERLGRLRMDYSVAAVRHHRTPNHDLIVMAVRHSLAKLSYFRSAKLRTDIDGQSSEKAEV